MQKMTNCKDCAKWSKTRVRLQLLYQLWIKILYVIWLRNGSSCASLLTPDWHNENMLAICLANPKMHLRTKQDCTAKFVLKIKKKAKAKDYISRVTRWYISTFTINLHFSMKQYMQENNTDKMATMSDYF